MVDPGKRTVDVCHDVENPVTLAEADSVTDEALLPGFELSIAQWFRQAEEV